MRRFTLALMILAALWAAPVQASTWLTGWDHRIPITVQASQVIGTANLTNFPVYVNLGAAIPAAMWAVIQADGGDIAVTDSTGTTKLVREVSALNTGSGTGQLYFRAPTLLAATNTRFFIYFGNDAANETNSTDVWSNSYYAVWHFEEGAANTQQDSGPNNLDATVSTAGSDITGKVGAGLSVAGTTRYDVALLANASTSLTYAAWVNRLTDGLTSSRLLLNTGNQESYFGWGVATPDPQASYWSGSAWHGFGQNVGFPSASTWAQMVWARSGTAVSYYLNGDSLASVTAATTRDFRTPGTMFINVGSSGWVGYIDEYRIATVRRSSAWIATEYNSVADPGSFYVVGSLQTFTASAPIIALPDVIYAAVGREVAIRYDQLTPQTPEHERITYGCSSAVGTIDASGFSFTPTAAGSHSVIISMADAWNDTTVYDTTSVSAVASDRGTGTYSALFIGDSIFGGTATTNCIVADSTDSYFTADGGANLRFIGTWGQAPIYHQAWGGWTWTIYATAHADNPFWIGGQIDFQSYIADSLQTPPIDFCVVHLGGNDVFGQTSVVDAAFLAALTGKVDDFCDAMLSPVTGYPDCKIVLVLPSLGSADTLEWRADYPTNYYWPEFEQNYLIYNKTLIDRYDAGAYHANVSVCAAGANVNRDADYTGSYLHPNSAGDGFAHIANGIYAHLRALLLTTSMGPKSPRNQSMGGGGSGLGGDLGGQ